MKEGVKTRWVEALRSGRFEQGVQALCENGRFCCLGVLCEVLGVPKEPCGVSPGVFGYGDGRGVYTASLPPAAVAAAGMASRTGDYGSTDADDKSLTLDNDYGKTFAEIADTIEKNWETL